jgi:hypothetical protein
MAKAAPSKACTRPKLNCSCLAVGPGQLPGQHEHRRNRRDPRPALPTRLPAETRSNRLDRCAGPLVGRPGRQRRERQPDQAAPAPAGASGARRPGSPGWPGPARIPQDRCTGQGANDLTYFLEEMLPAARELETEKVRQLQRGDHHADARGEAEHDGVRYELDQRAHPRQAQRHQDDPRHDGGEQQAPQPVLLDDRQQDHHEGRCRSGYIESRAAGQGDDRPGDDRGVEPVLGRDAGGDGERHGQGNGHDADGQAGENVLAKIRRTVAGGERRTQAGADGRRACNGVLRGGAPCSMP